MSETPVKRGEPPREQDVRKAGAFYRVGGENLGILAPMRTLDDDYWDEPTEPEDSDRIPDPEPPGFVRRLLERLMPRRP